MKFTAEIDYEKLSKAFEKIPLVAARELRIEINKGLCAVQVDARLHHDFKPHSGKLERSVQEDVESTGLSGKVWLEEGVASYGKFVHDGTGLYGPKKQKYPIKPKNKKLLYFVSKKEGHLIGKSGVMHPGIRPDKFLFEAFDRQKPLIMAQIHGAVKRIFEAVGLK